MQNKKEQYDKIVAIIDAKNWEEIFKDNLKKLARKFGDHGGLTPHFVNGFANEDSFYESLWEMQLFAMLKDSHENVEINIGTGPDFFLPNLNVWIEAMAPKPIGLPEEYKNFPSNGKMDTYQIPHEEISLRWTTAMKEKREKLNKYIKEGTVKEDQGFIVAVTGSQLGALPMLHGISTYPYPAEIAYGIGALSVNFFLDDPSCDEYFLQPQDSVKNKNGSPVNTKIFFDDRYENVSAILGAIVGPTHVLGRTEHYVLVHNHKAKNPLKTEILKSGNEYSIKEYSVEGSEDGRYQVVSKVR